MSLPDTRRFRLRRLRLSTTEKHQGYIAWRPLDAALIESVSTETSTEYTVLEAREQNSVSYCSECIAVNLISTFAFTSSLSAVTLARAFLIRTCQLETGDSYHLKLQLEKYLGIKTQKITYSLLVYVT